MISIRPLHWPADRAALCALDTSFTTDRIYQVIATAHGFELRATAIAPALHKDYRLADDADDLPGCDYVAVAEVGGALAGVAALRVEAWNRRAVLWHLYVDRALRGRGVGRTLLADAVRAARALGASRLWLETQNINYAGVQFYRRAGLQCCGLDTALYDPGGPAGGEVAIFFAAALG